MCPSVCLGDWQDGVPFAEQGWDWQKTGIRLGRVDSETSKWRWRCGAGSCQRGDLIEVLGGPSPWAE